MIKQNYVTIKELDEKLDEREKNILINYVSQAVGHIEAMEASCSDIIGGSNVKVSASVPTHSESSDQKKFDIEVTNTEISLFHNDIYADDPWKSLSSKNFSCEKGDYNELLAKSIILMFLLTALKDKGIGEVVQIGFKDALADKNMTAFERRIEELAARLLIPKKVFTHELAQDIIKLWENEDNELLSIAWERQILLKKLQSYGTNEKMARVRLRIAVFDGEYYTSEDKTHLDDFTRYYEEESKTKEPCKQMNDGKK